MPLHLALILFFSVLAKRWAGKSISSLTYLVLSGMLNLNSVNQVEEETYATCHLSKMAVRMVLCHSKFCVLVDTDVGCLIGTSVAGTCAQCTVHV